MTDDEHPYKPEAWRMTGYYPGSYAKFMSALGIGLDYGDDDFERYEAQFLADLTAHDATVFEAGRREGAETARDNAAFLAEEKMSALTAYSPDWWEWSDLAAAIRALPMEVTE